MLMVKGRGTNVRGQVEKIVFQKKEKLFKFTFTKFLHNWKLHA